MTRKRSHSDIEENPRTVSEGSFAPQNHTTTDTSSRSANCGPRIQSQTETASRRHKFRLLLPSSRTTYTRKRPVVLSHQTAGEEHLDRKEGEIAAKGDDGEVVLEKVD